MGITDEITDNHPIDICSAGSQIELNKREFGLFCCSSTPPIVCKKNAYWPASGVPTAAVCMYIRTCLLRTYYVSNPFAKLSLGWILNCLGLLAQYTPLQQLTLLLLLPTVVCQYTASLYGYSVYSVYITTVCLIIITA